MTREQAHKRAHHVHYATVRESAKLLSTIGKIAPMQLAKYGFYFYTTNKINHIILLPEGV